MCEIIYAYRRPTGISDMHIVQFSYSGDQEQRWLQIWSDTTIKLESTGTWNEICQLETEMFIIFYHLQRA